MDTFTAQRISEAIVDVCTSEPGPGDGNVVTCRKAHVCAACGRVICKGERARFYEGRVPRYADGQQVGIEYYREWLHTWCGEE